MTASDYDHIQVDATILADHQTDVILTNEAMANSPLLRQIL
jgi:hypothetical protein